jgi:hypothetical protein
VFIDGAGEILHGPGESHAFRGHLARRGELAALEVRDIDFHPKGTGRRSLPRQDGCRGTGGVAYLSRETVKWLTGRLEHSGTGRPFGGRLVRTK